ncbi:MAG TPA: nitroreductase family protein [Alphaproteobacteria bacterium]|nr:nitroreductase family protein [Alphaproteobacteria bacterium]
MTEKAAKTLADLIEYRYGLPTDVGKDRPAEGQLAQILDRRSHRRWKEEPVPEDLLQTLLACAFSASAKSDLQQSGIILIRDKEKQQAITDLIPAMPWIASAPVFMIWIGDNRRIRRICEMRNKPFGNDHLDSFLNAATDCALAMQTFILAAESQGLGCCPISNVRNHAAKLREMLELPKYVFPYAGLCAGYPAREGYSSMRLPLSCFVHEDRYDDGDLPEEIDGYDRRRAARHTPPKESWRGLDKWGEPDFYGWSEDKARQVAVPERDRFGSFIREQGIKLD